MTSPVHIESQNTTSDIQSAASSSTVEFLALVTQQQTVRPDVTQYDTASGITTTTASSPPVSVTASSLGAQNIKTTTHNLNQFVRVHGENQLCIGVMFPMCNLMHSRNIFMNATTYQEINRNAYRLPWNLSLSDLFLQTFDYERFEARLNYKKPFEVAAGPYMGGVGIACVTCTIGFILLLDLTYFKRKPSQKRKKKTQFQRAQNQMKKR